MIAITFNYDILLLDSQYLPDNLHKFTHSLLLFPYLKTKRHPE